VDYSQTGLDDDVAAIRLQAFDASGGKIGGEIIVNTTTNGNQLDPSIAALTDGRVVVTWTDESAGNQNIRMQIVDPRDGVVAGTPGADTLYGHNSVGDEISGGAGNDWMSGLGGNDSLYGGAGNDTLLGGGGDDEAYGGLGNDNFIGGSGPGDDYYDGEQGSDAVTFFSATQTVTVNLTTGTATGAEIGSDTLVNIENVYGGSGNDSLTGDDLANTLFGSAGNDTLIGNGGNDFLDGAAGNDTMQGGTGNDTYVVDSASDVVTELAGQGTDLVRTSVNFNLGANVENLTQLGSANLNSSGNTLANVMTGNSGNNALSGGDGNDTISGGGGNDFLNGGLGNDTLTGGAGNDSFLFNTAISPTPNVDTLPGFSVADDTIRLDDAIFTEVGALGTLAAAAFRIGAAAADASDRIIYNSANGALFYDADGNGAGVAIQFALLPVGLAMTNADFLIV
jgi:Ca2+-binding RTX toxin-like protein